MKKSGQALLAFIVSFGLWFLVGAFLANNWNILEWSIFGKIIYLVFSFTSWGELLEEI